MRTSAATLHSWRHDLRSFGIVKKCVRGGGGAADLPRTLTFTYMAGNNKPAYLHQIDITDFVICSMPKLRMLLMSLC